MIPDKLYFKIGEVSKITRVKPHVLRYWEGEFKIINPVKSRGNQRVYKKKDVELVLFIKKLINEDRHTLDGVKKRLKEFKRESKPQLDLPFSDASAKKYREALKDIRKDLFSIKEGLK